MTHFPILSVQYWYTYSVWQAHHSGSKIIWLLILGHIRWKDAGYSIDGNKRGGRKGYQCDQNYNLVERWFHCALFLSTSFYHTWHSVFSAHRCFFQQHQLFSKQLSATHSCFPLLCGTSRSNPVHQRSLLVRGIFCICIKCNLGCRMVGQLSCYVENHRLSSIPNILAPRRVICWNTRIKSFSCEYSYDEEDKIL